MAKQASVETRSESIWLGRTHFSRAICYRFENCVAPDTPERLFWDELILNRQPAVSKLKDLGLLHNAKRKTDSLDWFHSEAAQRPTTASSAVSSPVLSTEKQNGHVRSLSLPRDLGSSRYEKKKCDDEGGRHEEDSEAKWATSWSDYFTASAGIYAVKAAEEYMIDLSQLFLGHRFASGTYSRLYHGIYKDKPVAVKFQREPDDNEEIAKRVNRQFLCEVNILSRVRHRNIVEFVGACRKPPVCCIITEFLPEGSLRAFLHKRELYSLPLAFVMDMALDVARGMNYLHSRGIIHRDLKSENLLPAEDLCVKITDFGVACFEADYLGKMEDLGTFRWMAPEMINNKPYSRKVDIYSFGIVLWELLTGQVPFQEMTAVQAAFAVVHKYARPVIPPNCPSALADLMQQCWSTNPEKRPDFFEIVKALEEIKTSSQTEMSLNAWQRHHKHTNVFLRCFTGCLSKDLLD